MTDTFYHVLTMLGTLAGLYVAYRSVSMQLKHWQETSQHERDRQHAENTRKLDKIENAVEIMLTPIYDWWIHRHDEHDE